MSNTSERIKDEQALLHALGLERKRQHVTLDELAARMHTKGPTLHRWEKGGIDSRMSTFQKYAAGLGLTIEFRLVRAKG